MAASSGLCGRLADGRRERHPVVDRHVIEEWSASSSVDFLMRNAARSAGALGSCSPAASVRAVGVTAPGAPARALAHLSVAQTRIAAIVIGGVAGTLARAGLGEALPQRAGHWPWSTFIVNLVGSFILGWLLTRLAERTAPSRYWRFLAGTGFCGALTTFSTFEVETFQLARGHHVVLAVAYPAVSLTAGMLVAIAGVIVARWGRHW
jgi:CrcB protein